MTTGRNYHVFVGESTPGDTCVGSRSSHHEALELAAAEADPGQDYEILKFDGHALYRYATGYVLADRKRAVVR